MRNFKRFVFPLFQAIVFIFFVFKGSEVIFREVFFPSVKLMSRYWFHYLLNLDSGRLFSRFIFFIWAGILYLFVELLLSKRKFSQNIIFQTKHKLKNFFKGSFWGSLFAFVLLGFLLFFKKMEFVGIEANIIFQTLISALSVFVITFSLELVFRAFILHSLTKNFNIHVAVFISAVLYGSIFFQKILPYYPVMQLLSGIMLGYLFVLYGFYFSLGVHFAWKFVEAFFLNGSAVYMTEPPIFKEGDVPISAESFLGSILIALILCLFFVFFRKKLFSKPYLS